MNAATSMMTLAYRPFLDPLSLHKQWFLLLIPTAFFVSLAYKAVRVHNLRTLPKVVLTMTIQVVLGMVALWILVYLVVEKLLPIIAPKP